MATSEETNMLSEAGAHQENAETTFDMKIRFSDTLNASLQGNRGWDAVV